MPPLVYHFHSASYKITTIVFSVYEAFANLLAYMKTFGELIQ